MFVQSRRAANPAGLMLHRVHLRRSIAAAAAPAVIAAALATLPAGLLNGSASAAAVPATPAMAVAWHKLGLINGWQANNGVGESGPKYAISGGVVYLTGFVAQPVSGSALFAVLPKGARPAHTLYRAVSISYFKVGTMRIQPNGDMYAYSKPGQYARYFTSLTGVSFPVAGFTWHKLSLRNGWERASIGTGSPSYSIKGGVVYLSGALRQLAAGGNEFAVLPKAARPPHTMRVTVYANGGSAGTVVIGSNGVMRALALNQAGARKLTSLAMISFPSAATRWHKLTLIEGAQPTAGAGAPAYAIIGGVVYLSGAAVTGVSSVFTSMPANIRPVHYLVMPVYVGGLSDGTLTFDIDQNRGLQLFGKSSSFSLSALAYPVNS